MESVAALLESAGYLFDSLGYFFVGGAPVLNETVRLATVAANNLSAEMDFSSGTFPAVSKKDNAPRTPDGTDLLHGSSARSCK